MTYSLKEADDGWETISEAQNAAATLAIFEVLITMVLPLPPLIKCGSVRLVAMPPPLMSVHWRMMHGSAHNLPSRLSSKTHRLTGLLLQ